MRFCPQRASQRLCLAKQHAEKDGAQRDRVISPNGFSEGIFPLVRSPQECFAAESLPRCSHALPIRNAIAQRTLSLLLG